MKRLIKKPLAFLAAGRRFVNHLSGKPRHRQVPFPGSKEYWERRYEVGGTSGAGSYGRLAEFKARILNSFVAQNGVQSVIEFGCGDGNQLSLAKYPRYVGVDVSPNAIARCKERFQDDETKSFLPYDQYKALVDFGTTRSELSLSLDVIFHLVEDDVFEEYMSLLFTASAKYVIVYSSNRDESSRSAHVRHRAFSLWVGEHCSDWSLVNSVPNEYPYDPENPKETSFADFFIYEKSTG